MKKSSWHVAYAVILVACVLATQAAQAKRKPLQEIGPDHPSTSTSAETITWWCLNLDDLLHVGVPVIVGAGSLIAPDPAPFPTSCTPTGFPVAVPNGSSFVAGGLTAWYTNKTYSPFVRQMLAADGYKFGSNNPPEDLMSKLDEIRVDVITFPDNQPVASFSFDPRKNFRLLQYRNMYEAFGPPDAVNDPAAGVSLTSDEVSRLPLLVFPGEIGPVPPGQYRARIYWHLTDTHNDGLGLQDIDFLPPGWTSFGAPRFVVTP